MPRSGASLRTRSRTRSDGSRTRRRLGAAALGLLAGLAPIASAQQGLLDVAVWADAVVALDRGFFDIDQPELGEVTYGLGSDGLVAEGDTIAVVSLGDAGAITLEFADPIPDGEGADLAVFENGIVDQGTGLLFAELAFVEVSSNGVDFARFATATTRLEPVPPFGSIDPAEYDGFAGLHAAGTGTGFDLADLAGHPLVVAGLLDPKDVVFVRLVDVIGDGTTFDDAALPVHDPYPTLYPTGGFDLDGVGALHVPEPSAAAGLAAGAALLAALARRRAGRGRGR